VGDIIKLSDVRNSCDLSSSTGEDFLKELVIRSIDSEESEEFKVFLSAVRALREGSPKENIALKMQVKYNREKELIDFTFKFELDK
jgi:hypothetical protein